MNRNRYRALIVDDEPALRKALKRLLDSAGYEAITASNGETAIQLAKEKKPDIVLLDIIMPGIDGREVLRTVRELSTTTKAIYFSAKAAPMEPQKLKEIHREADAFIAKPATSKKILSTMNSLLSGPGR